MRNSWYLYTKKADFDLIAERFGIDPVTARILRNRDIAGNDAINMFLNGGISDLYDEGLLPDIDIAAELIADAVRNDTSIRIVGDYDIDGVCSTAILLDGLRAAGARADHRIPDRIKDGYGINMRIVDEAIADGVGLILTCDNGIAAVEELKKAKENGITVVITDHHNVRKDELGQDIVPPADAVVDVKCEGSRYPTEEICGTVTAWKLIKHLYDRLGRDDSEWLKYTDLAAIATIGDIMPLIGENRIIVKEGLRIINGGRRLDEPDKRGTPNVGLSELMKMLELDSSPINTYHIGFIIGPCINAGGRLESAETALRLFMTKDRAEAELLAGHLKLLNEERKAMTEEGVELGLKLLDSEYRDDKVVVAYIPGLHESLAGIVAGRLKESCYKPVIVVTDAEDGLKGSGRSIESYNMFDGLCAAAAHLTKFGGHKMAAGLSLRPEELDAFREQLNEDAELCEKDFEKKLWIDAAMPLGYISTKLVEELNSLAPFGNGFEKPQFAAKSVHLTGMRVLGRQKNVLRLSLRDAAGVMIDGIMFGDAETAYEELKDAQQMDILYCPEINEFAGRRKLQLQIKDYRIR